MSRNAKLHEALARLASKFEYGALMAETQPVAFIDLVVERLGALEAQLREAEERIKKFEDAVATNIVHEVMLEDRAEKAERERDEARRRLRNVSALLHVRVHEGVLWSESADVACRGDRSALGEKP